MTQAMKRIQPEQSLSALPNLVPEDSFCSSGKEGGEKEEVEEWADVDLDLNLWHLDLEEVASWGIGEVGVHAMETECHQQAPANGSISLPMRMPMRKWYTPSNENFSVQGSSRPTAAWP